MKIKRATEAEASEILSLQKLSCQSQAEIYNDFTIPPLHQALQQIKSEFKSQRILKTVENGRIVGSVRAFLAGGTCFIGKLIVPPDYQNRGIGTCLLETIQAHFIHVRCFESFTGVKSEKNRYLYRKHGFKASNYKKINRRLTLVFMEKHSDSNRTAKTVNPVSAARDLSDGMARRDWKFLLSKEPLLGSRG